MKKLYIILPEVLCFLFNVSVFSQSGFNNIIGSVDTAWVRSYMSALLSQDDDVNSLVVDTDGNIYVIGNVSNLQAGEDFCVIKYDMSGNRVWIRYYNGSGNGDDYAASLTIDKYNNIYITGGCYDIYGYIQICTIKLNAEGELLWANQHGVPFKDHGSGVDIAVDTMGNVYVAADIHNSWGDSDIGIIKYNSSGDTLWTRFYNGSANAGDLSRKLCVDGAGNVYVTGVVYNAGAWTDIVTIKYTADGLKEWDNNYNGPSNYQDYSSDIAIDSNGNIYVTGWTLINNSNSNFITIKYDNGGHQQWAVMYDGPVSKNDWASSIVVSKSGSVYVTGGSYGSLNYSDIFTLKYNEEGILQWSARVDSGSNFSGSSCAIALDQTGHIYVTGYKSTADSSTNYVTIKYDTNGVEKWKAISDHCFSSDNPYAMGVYNSENIFVTGLNYCKDSDILTIKYDGNGIEQWRDIYNGPGSSDDQVVGIAADDSGNVYISAKSKSPLSDYDYLTLKYNASGEMIWTARYDNTSHNADEPVRIVLDKWNNVIVTGSNMDITTVKYNSDGEQQWVANFDGTLNSQDRAMAITVDDSGNVYVTGQCYNNETLDDILTIKYNKGGTQQWVAFYNGVDNFGDCGKDIVTDKNGNVYVTGQTHAIGSSSDFITIKYNSNGDTIWTRRFNSGPNGDDNPVAMTVDNSGNIFVTGISYPAGQPSDFLTVRYDSSGTEVWAVRFNGAANLNDIPAGISVDKMGNIFVTGKTSTVDGTDILTIKYDINGDTVWTSQYNSPGSNNNYVSTIIVDSMGYSYVSGCTDQPVTGEDFLSIKYSPDGVIDWITEYSTPLYASDNIVAAILDVNGNYIVAGTNSSGDNNYFTVIKYYQDINNVDDNIHNVPLNYSLSQNFPNPFNPVTNINFEIPMVSYVTLKVYNILGEVVKTLIDERREAGKYHIQYDASALSSGVYFYRLQANEFVQTKKFILMK